MTFTVPSPQQNSEEAERHVQKVANDTHERKTLVDKIGLKGQTPEAVINSHPGAALAEHGGRMAVDNCSHWEKRTAKRVQS